jgi:DNA polymerase
MWSERQQTMLRQMGLRVWTAPAPIPVAALPAPPAAVAGRVAPPPPKAVAPAPVPPSPQGVETAPALPATPVPQPATVAAVPRADVAMLDWPALRAAVAACRGCGLCESRTQTVFGVGHTEAHWMVVGEAPGEQEDRQGEPFVGAAGQLLDRMLAALQLTRSEAGDAPPSQRVYIANTLKCRPPRNRNPAPQELAQCEPYLQRQIELLQPRLILAMGPFAVQALLRSEEPIGRLRGRVHRYHGVPLVVTYHPAYLLRNPADKSRAWEDLCLAASVVGRASAP